MKAILNYPGAKWGMAEFIASIMPRHRSYLEPFFGSGAVLFNKTPSSIETVNDIDGEIVNFFSVLKKEAKRLAEMISITPYSRDVFEKYKKAAPRTKLERAFAFAVKSRMAFGYKTYCNTGFKIDIQGRERSYALDCWNNMPDLLFEAAYRLKNVQIENRPAIELIKRFNYENVLIYADPPYLLKTRGGKQYKYEMTDEDHVNLLSALCDHKGYVILSGYDSDMYNDMLKNWKRISKKRYNQNSEQRTEVLWVNYDLQETLLDDLNDSGGNRNDGIRL